MEKKELISCQNVCVNYGSLIAVDNVSFSLHEGDYLCVVGANGSGKSTLIKLLLRELTATSGSVYVMGSDLGKLRHRHISKFRRVLPSCDQ